MNNILVETEIEENLLKRFKIKDLIGLINWRQLGEGGILINLNTVLEGVLDEKITCCNLTKSIYQPEKLKRNKDIENKIMSLLSKFGHKVIETDKILVFSDKQWQICHLEIDDRVMILYIIFNTRTKNYMITGLCDQLPLIATPELYFESETEVDEMFKMQDNRLTAKHFICQATKWLNFIVKLSDRTKDE